MMISAERSLPDLLLAVRAELDAATAVDTVSLARPRAKLAWIASLLPAQRAEARRLLDCAAEVASAIGLVETDRDNDRRRLNATRGAVDAVVAYLAAPDADGQDLLIAQAGQRLLRTIGRDPDLWQRGNFGVVAACA